MLTREKIKEILEYETFSVHSHNIKNYNTTDDLKSFETTNLYSSPRYEGLEIVEKTFHTFWYNRSYDDTIYFYRCYNSESRPIRLDDLSDPSVSDYTAVLYFIDSAVFTYRMSSKEKSRQEIDNYSTKDNNSDFEKIKEQTNTSDIKKLKSQINALTDLLYKCNFEGFLCNKYEEYEGFNWNGMTNYDTSDKAVERYNLLKEIIN